ncbi:MAG: LysE family translocator [Bacteroidales bacterium]
MDISIAKYFLDGLLIGLLASVPVGPLAILVIQRTVNKNFNSGFISGLGVAFGDLFYAIIAGYSFSYIHSMIKRYDIFIHSLGIMVLICLGIFIYRKNPVKEIRQRRNKKAGYFGDFASSFLLTISNPLLVFIFLALFTGFGITLNLSQHYINLALFGGIISGCIVWWASLAGVINIFRHRFTLRILWWFNKVAGVIIILVAVYYVVDMLIKYVLV